MRHLTTAIAVAFLTVWPLPQVAALELSPSCCGWPLPQVAALELSPSCCGGGGRRQFLQAMPAAAMASLSVAAVPAAPAQAAGPDVRKYTALAPLGPADATTSSPKRTGMPLSTIAAELAEDLAHGHTGRGGYFVSGDIDTSIFSDACRFVDPTNNVASLSRYQVGRVARGARSGWPQPCPCQRQSCLPLLSVVPPHSTPPPHRPESTHDLVRPDAIDREAPRAAYGGFGLSHDQGHH